jgi:hypothetical protein
MAERKTYDEAAAHLKHLADIDKEYEEERRRFGRAQFDPTHSV